MEPHSSRELLHPLWEPRTEVQLHTSRAKADTLFIRSPARCLLGFRFDKFIEVEDRVEEHGRRGRDGI